MYLREKISKYSDTTRKKSSCERRPCNFEIILVLHIKLINKMTNAYHTLLCMYQCRKVYANIVHAIEVDKRFYDLKRYSTRTDVEMAVKGYQPNAVF